MRGGAALLAALAAVLAGCARDGGEAAAAPVLAVVPLGAAPPPGPAAVARAEVASTPDARERGLMFRSLLAEDSGMLFAYPADRPLSFWMKNCRIPLSVAFLDASGRVLEVLEMAPGEGLPEASLPRYESPGPARYALEMEAGWFARKGVRPGDRADLSAVLRGVEPR